MIPCDAKAMMRAKARKKGGVNGGNGGFGDMINNGVGAVGGGEGANPAGGSAVCERLEAASRVVAAATLC